MTFRRFLAATSLIVLFGVLSAMVAQQAKTPTLDEILQRLEANLNHYDKSLPSLFCDEQVVSRVEPGASNRDTVTDSVFHLKRTANPDHTTALVESRDIKSVNGKPASSQDMKGPTLLSGVFEGGLAVVSHNQRGCMRYTLERIKAGHTTAPYVIRFSTKLNHENIEDCLLQEKSKGRVVIDPASMEITHLELTTPQHVIIPGDGYAKPVIGKRELTVDYAPVVLDGDIFWMPSAITSRDASTSEGFHVTVWSYRATYRNYHRLEVKSRILPAGERPER